MGWCFKIFKIIVICMQLVSFGLGYFKFYLLIVGIKDTLASIGDTNSINDLAWIPFLVLQVCTTVFMILQIYCLIRELCEDDYMYKHCFGLAFVLTLLMYSISIIPKSVLSIIYHNFDVTIEEWWNKVVNVLESLFSSLGTLGFQIILYIRIFKRAFRSAGACKKNVVTPLDSDKGKTGEGEKGETSKDDDVNETGCCLFVKKTKMETTEETGSVDERNQTGCWRSNKVMRTANRMKNVIETRVAKVSEWKNNKEKEIKDIRSKMKAAIITNVKTNAVTKAIIDKKEKAVTELEQAKDSAKRKIMIEKNKDSEPEAGSKYMAEIYCSECGVSYSGSDVSSEKNCTECGKVIDSEMPADKHSTTTTKSRCQNIKGKLCCICENRPLCLIITLSLANLHMFVYIIELFFIVCPWCK